MNRIIVGANYGLKDWLAQRVTAVVMVAYTLLVFVAVLGGAALLKMPELRWLAKGK